MTARYGVLLSGTALAVLLTACTSGGTADPTPRSAPAVPTGPRTTVTYQPRWTVTPAELQETAEVVRKRATVLGLTGPQVAVDSGRITLSVIRPGGQLSALGMQGQLFFRPVVAVAPSLTSDPVGTTTPTAPTAGAAPADLAESFRRLNCSAPDQRTNHQGEPTAGAVACSKDATPNGTANGGYFEKLALGPVVVDGKYVKKAEAALDPQVSGNWTVMVTFDDAGAKAFADATGRLSTQDPPTNQFAIVVDGLVLSHPAVLTAITGGSAVISGGFTQDTATALAAQLTDRLPVGLAVVSETTDAT